MEKLMIWMLSWEGSMAPGGTLEVWQPVARSLASQIRICVLLPHNDPPASMENVTIIDLDTVDLPPRTKEALPPESLPFAPIPFPFPTIPLYGTPVYTGKETGRPSQRHPGEAVRTGHQNQPAGGSGGPETAQQMPATSLHARVIEYARKVSRFAHGQSFDGIYAFHWQTYLAALELKLITGKKMVLQVHALSKNRQLPDRLAWMLEIEKQAFDKADAILVDHEGLAADVKNEYRFAGTKLWLAGGKEQVPQTLQHIIRQQPPGLPYQKAPPDLAHPSESKPQAITTTGGRPASPLSD